MSSTATKRRPWIRMRLDLPHDPDVVGIARRLQASGGLPSDLSVRFAADVVVSRLLQLWGRFHVDAEGALLPGHSLELLDDFVGVRGLATELARIGWLVETEAGVRVHDPADYIGSAKSNRDKYREQKRPQGASATDDDATEPHARPCSRGNGGGNLRGNLRGNGGGRPRGRSASASASDTDSDSGSNASPAVPPLEEAALPFAPRELEWMPPERWTSSVAALVAHARSKTRLRRLDSSVLLQGVTAALVLHVGDRPEDDDLPEADREQSWRIRRNPAFTDPMPPIRAWIDDLVERATGKPAKYLRAALAGGPTTFEEPARA